MTTRNEHDDPVLERLVLERLVLDQRPGPAPRISSARANALVQAAMNDAYASGILEATALDAAVATKRSKKRASIFQSSWLRASAMAAAGLLMLVGGAAAAKLVIQTIWPGQPAVVAAPQAQPAPAPKKARVPEQVAVPSEPALDSDALEERDALEPTPVKSARRDDRELDTISEDLLQAANRARAAGQFRDAADTYAEVYERHSSSLSAYVAEVAAGSLELEHLDRPDRAARLFRRALRTRPDGALDLEARQGLAIALRDLGRERDEVIALKALVAAHPDRPAAERARARLIELGAATKP